MLIFNDVARDQLLNFLIAASAHSPHTPLIDTTTIEEHLPWLSEVFEQLTNDNVVDFMNLHHFLHYEAYEHDEISGKSLSDFWLFCFNYPTMTKETQKEMIKRAMFLCLDKETFHREKFDLLLQVILQVSSKENDLVLIELLTGLFCGEKRKEFKIVFNKIPEALKQSLFPLLLNAAVDYGNLEIVKHFAKDYPELFKDVDQVLQQRSNTILALNDSDCAFFSKSINPFLTDSTDSGAIALTPYSSRLIMAARIARKKDYDHTLTFLDKTVEKTLFVSDLSSEVAFLGVDFSNKNLETQTKAFEIINDEKQDLRKKCLLG